MSRNTEKSQSALHRFQAYKNREAGVLESNPNLRPKYVQSVDSLPQAEKWRSTIISEISYKLTRVQDPDLNDFQLRDTNDDLNKLFKEKRAWEYHIKDLGGNDYLKYGDKLFSTGVTGRQTDSQPRNYRYFGRAKELPEMKDYLSEKQKLTERTKSSRSKRSDQREMKEKKGNLTPTYYGYYDEEDQDEMIDSDKNTLCREINSILGYEVLKPSSGLIDDEFYDNDRKENVPFITPQGTDDTGAIKKSMHIEDFETSIPTDADVSNWIVQKRKKDLLNRLKINQKV